MSKRNSFSRASLSLPPARIRAWTKSVQRKHRVRRGASETKPAPRKDDNALIEEMNEGPTEMDDLLEYDEEKDVRA